MKTRDSLLSQKLAIVSKIPTPIVSGDPKWQIHLPYTTRDTTFICFSLDARRVGSFAVASIPNL